MWHRCVHHCRWEAPWGHRALSSSRLLVPSQGKHSAQSQKSAALGSRWGRRTSPVGRPPIFPGSCQSTARLWKILQRSSLPWFTGKPLLPCNSSSAKPSSGQFNVPGIYKWGGPRKESGASKKLEGIVSGPSFFPYGKPLPFNIRQEGPSSIPKCVRVRGPLVNAESKNESEASQ